MIAASDILRLMVCKAALSFLVIGVILCSQSAASEQPPELLLGVEPEHNIFDQMERYRKLAGYLSEHLGIQVNLAITSRYGEVINRLKARRLDGAFLSSFTAALAITTLELDPVASTVHLGGESHSRGYIFVRSDSGIQTLVDMEGKSIVFVDPASTEGYLFPMAVFKKHGVNDKTTFFKRHYFSGSHASAIFAVLDGRADIGAAKNTVYNTQVSLDPSIGDELAIIKESPNVPEEILCLRNNLPEEIKEKIQMVLLSMETTSRGRNILRQFRALRFIKASRIDLDPVLEIAHEAGISLTGEITR